MIICHKVSANRTLTQLRDPSKGPMSSTKTSIANNRILQNPKLDERLAEGNSKIYMALEIHLNEQERLGRLLEE